MQDMNQREVVYADVHVVTAESHAIEMVLDDDRVEYAELNHNIKTTLNALMAVSPQKDEATSENYSNFINRNFKLIDGVIIMAYLQIM